MAKTRGLARIPNLKPITIGCFTLTTTGMEVHGRPSFGEYEGVGDFIQRANQASGFWLADWLRYGESRADWKERLDQAIESTGKSEKTLKNIRAVGTIEPSRRRDDVEFAHHAVVTSLSPSEQTHWLERSHAEGWTERELRMEIRAAKRSAVIEGQAHLEGMFRFIYADFPWLYGNKLPKSATNQEQQYPGMTIEDGIKLFAESVKPHAMPVSTLAFWVTAPFLFLNPGPREIIEAAGFEYKANFVWDKVLGNPGSYNHVTHEHLIIATRGGDLPDVPTPQPKSVIVERRSSIHSGKPESVRKMIEKHYTRGPYLELFGREPRPRWTVFGNDARLWAQEMAGELAGV